MEVLYFKILKSKAPQIRELSWDMAERVVKRALRNDRNISQITTHYPMRMQELLVKVCESYGYDCHFLESDGEVIL